MRGERRCVKYPGCFCLPKQHQSNPRLASIGRLPWTVNVYTFALKRVNGEFVLRACLCCCVCCAVPGAVLAVVGALWLARVLLSRPPRIVDEAGVLEVSGKDREAKQSKRRGRCQFGTIWSLSSWRQEPGGRQKSFSETVKVIGCPYVCTIPHATRSDRPGPVLASFSCSSVLG